MSTLRNVFVVAGAAIAVAALGTPPASAAELRRPKVSWLRGEGNFTKSHRRPKAIDCIVVHVTEGPFWGSISWLRNQHSHASSHYIVSRRGRIVQLVHDSDIAWHAGNWRVNAESIGIEHEGFVDDAAGFTDAQYHASARLVAYIARRGVMAIDRRHIIGHDEVPNPFDPTKLGGSDAHTDPGPRWDWPRYLRLVRRYATPPRPRPRIRLTVDSRSIRPGQILRGRRRWAAVAGGARIARVDFLVDGRLRWRDRTRPFAFARGAGLNTFLVRNGRHTLELRAYGPRGSWTRTRFAVRVSNRPFTVRAALPSSVSGIVPVRAQVGGAKARRLELRIDGRRVDHDTRAPFAFRWDSGRLADGRHTVEVRARAVDGRLATRRAVVYVTNGVAGPAPTIAAQSLVDGQQLAGTVEWSADVRGAVERVDFVVDGTVRATLTGAPWTFAWDTSAETEGLHRVTVRATGGGKAAEASAAVTVSRP
ncbi:MAG TPA: N-acetylmuramoyl-L-alanine amidase [Gaiellaceae bacterium]|nr:N-acetylmuramoyl-L-alanine amidase [Gaiellaceae bacterium]